jgi:hypothetical protein
MRPKSSGRRKQPWRWPDSLDALIAAPDNHTLLLETDCVRVVSARILPGQIVPVHTHRWASVLFILSWSDLVRRDHLGNVIPGTAQALESPILNMPTWHGPLPPHSVENVGQREINTIQVEIKGVS